MPLISYPWLLKKTEGTLLLHGFFSLLRFGIALRIFICIANGAMVFLPEADVWLERSHHAVQAGAQGSVGDH